MFERYSEQARKSIFLGRTEASQFGAREIELEHLLLGILYDIALISRVLPSTTPQQIREELEKYMLRTPQAVPASYEMPLNNEAKAALEYAVKAAETAGSKLIENKHLLAGIMQQQHSYAVRLLQEHGIRLEEGA